MKKTLNVLDTKRSNAINIGLTAMPPLRSIKTAILKMDTSVLTRENVEKILTTMLPTEEERTKIIEAQAQNPDLPLGNAEQLLLALSDIPEIRSRLELWLFKLDFENVEQDIAEPLMDLKCGLDDVNRSETFHFVLATVLTVGNFLNGSEVLITDTNT
jgi:FH1/FH2 domain-containing protein 3